MLFLSLKAEKVTLCKNFLSVDKLVALIVSLSLQHG